MSTLFDVPLVTEIIDPRDKKPLYWDDREFVYNVSEIKPDDWDDSELIEDADAIKPTFLDFHAKWTRPLIKNPNYKGKWFPKLIKNPHYSGE